jgi:hypothetical protein
VQGRAANPAPQQKIQYRESVCARQLAGPRRRYAVYVERSVLGAKPPVTVGSNVVIQSDPNGLGVDISHTEALGSEKR